MTDKNVVQKAAKRKGNPSNGLALERRRTSVLEAFEALLVRHGGRLTMPAREILDALAHGLERRPHKLSFQLAVARGEAEGRLRVDRTGRPNTYWLNREP